MKKLLFTALFCLWHLLAIGQIPISGIIQDENGAGMEFCNITLLSAQDSSFISGNISEAEGVFELSAPEGTYFINISSIGYDEYFQKIEIEGTEFNLPPIQLKMGATDLDEVVVKGKIPLVERKIDRLVFNMATSIISSGENLWNALRVVPGVLVIGDKSIQIAGKSGVKVMIDGRLSPLTGTQLTNYLKSIPAENVAKIEVITNPSARYDAEGSAGIINIQLKKSVKNGLNGNIHTNLGRGIFSPYGIGGLINGKNKDLSFVLSYDFSHDVSLSDGDEKRQFGNQNPILFHQQYYDRWIIDNHFARTGLDWQINENQTMGVNINGTYTQTENPYQATLDVSQNGIIDSTFEIINQLDNDFYNINAGAFYEIDLDTNGANLKFNYDYSFFQDERFSDFSSIARNAAGEILRPTETFFSTNPTFVNIHAATVDYALPTKSFGNFEFGAKFSSVQTDNEVVFKSMNDENIPVIDPTRSRKFDYQENIGALYSNWNKSLGSWEMQLGLRLENTNSDGISEGETIIDRNYWQLFPSVFIQRSLNENHQLNLSYSRRVSRPGYTSLSPFEFYFDPYSYKTGNPNIIPEIRHSVELAYTFFQQYSLSFSYLRSEDVISEVTSQDDEQKSLAYIATNLDEEILYSIDLSIPVDVTKWWSMYAYIGGWLNEYDSELPEGRFTSSQKTLNVYLSNDFSLPWDISAELSGFYLSGYSDGINQYDDFGSLSIGLQRNFLKDKLSIKVGASDLLGTNRERVTTTFANQNIFLRQTHDYRRVNLSLTYNFSRGAEFEKRSRKSGNEEEKNRVSF